MSLTSNLVSAAALTVDLEHADALGIGVNDHSISIQVSRFNGLSVGARRALVDYLADRYDDPAIRSDTDYKDLDDDTWGNYVTTGRYDGVPVTVWTAVTHAEHVTAVTV